MTDFQYRPEEEAEAKSGARDFEMFCLASLVVTVVGAGLLVVWLVGLWS